MIRWFCLDARIRAKAFYHNTNDDSRDRQYEFLWFFFFVTLDYANDPFRFTAPIHLLRFSFALSKVYTSYT